MLESPSSVRTFTFGGASNVVLSMNILTWNVRGLVKDFSNMHFVDIFCLPESKLEEISFVTWREIGGNRLNKFCFVSARGSARGIIIGWNNAVVTGTPVWKGTFTLTVEFYSKNMNLT